MVGLHFNKGLETLREIFSNNLSAVLIAEEIQICSLIDDAREIKIIMEKFDFDYYGVEKNGKVVGYIIQSELGEGLISNYIRPFLTEDLISESTSLIELLKILKEKDPIFVLEKNQVRKLITIADLQKQPIRMLVFGLVSLLEMRLLELIKEYYPNKDEWKGLINKSRLKKANEVYEIRKGKNEGLGLIDCLQLSDKGTIIKKTPKLLGALGFHSIGEVNVFFSSIEDLRNNTAHSQKYVYQDFNEFLDKISRIEEILTLI
ncbi:hypothetical protein RJD24_10440 [Bacillaceae bacterium IKA-2]|nr:hypothetical protein RJD24_10440 [Bacillaceae bacterium IKA-2]